MAAEEEAGAAGRSWWPCVAWTWARAQGGGRRAGGLGRLRPAGQKRGRGLLEPLVPFSIFLISFSQIFSKLILTYLKSFSGFAPKTKMVTNKMFYNFGLS